MNREQREEIRAAWRGAERGSDAYDIAVALLSLPALDAWIVGISDGKPCLLGIAGGHACILRRTDEAIETRFVPAGEVRLATVDALHDGDLSWPGEHARHRRAWRFAVGEQLVEMSAETIVSLVNEDEIEVGSSRPAGARDRGEKLVQALLAAAS